jgi:hypothetical protein
VTVSEPGDGVWRVEKALRSAVGEQAERLMHRRSRHLANLTPFEMSQDPYGAQIVMSELENIICQARYWK